jgi:hypothetical protein
LDFVFPSILFARKSASLPVRVPTIVSLLLLLSAFGLAAWALLFATVAVTASGQFLSFDYIGPMSGTLGEASRLTLFRKQTVRSRQAVLTKAAKNSSNNHGRWDKKRPAHRTWCLLKRKLLVHDQSGKQVCTFSNWATMKPTALRNFFLLTAIRKMARYFSAVFRFTEADAGCILLAYGLNVFELDRLQNSRSHEKEATREPLGTPAGASGKASLPVLFL